MIAALAASLVLGLNGAAGAIPGMTPAQLSRAWHVRVAPQYEPGMLCTSALVRVGGAWGTALFEGGRFSAVFFSGDVRTDTGIRIGSKTADLRRVYGARLESRPDKYVRGARNFFVKRRWQLRFDVTRDGTVTRIGFGNASVRLVEGCS